MFHLDLPGRQDIENNINNNGLSFSRSGPETASHGKREMTSDSSSSRNIQSSSPARGLRSSVAVLALLATAVPFVGAQQTCTSLRDSARCPAFNASSVATNSRLADYFPFLSNVTDASSFDSQLDQYVGDGYIRSKFQSRNGFGCSNINLGNTTDLYPRYTYSFICNAIIQLSLQDCSVQPGGAGSTPLCADSCSEFALSEQAIVSSPELCGNPGPRAMDQLRADFTHCAEPAQSLTSSCIAGFENEPDNCGYQDNLDGLCSYCATSSVNSTDSCCVTSRTESRCQNVKLPTYGSMQPLFTTASSAAPGATAMSASSNSTTKGLSGGEIAGIVIGAIVGAALLLGLMICCCLLARRRKKREQESSLNQPTPPISRGKSKKGEKFDPAPGARVTRMAALEGSSDSSPNNNHIGDSSDYQTPTDGSRGMTKTAGAAGMTAVPKRDKSQSDGLDESSPESQGYSSGDAAATGQSEQMDAFKDYYSPDDIHTGDAVATLWAYTPRANDEFELERGDMLRIVGIWDDGWATGARIHERIDQWEARNRQRDSGLSGNGAGETPPTHGDVKAFPLVCVCLPKHWRKTVEGDADEPNLSDEPSTD